MNKFNFIFDKTKKSQSLKKIILRKYKNHPVNKSDCIIVSGGDGFMLNTLKKYARFKIPFYGINCGTFGFLMNRYNSRDIWKKVNKAKCIKINPLKLKIVKKITVKKIW